MKARILYVSTAKSWRGGEQQLVYLYEELATLGIFQIIACRKNSELETYCKKHKLQHIAFPKRTSLDFSFAKKLAKAARHHKIDIVNPHDSHAHSFCIMAAQFFGMRQNIVLHRKVDYAVSSNKASLKKYNYPQIKKIICISEEVHRVLAPSINLPEKLIVIKDGIDIHKFKHLKNNKLRTEYNIPTEKTIIGNVAAITQQKDYFTFVETAKLIIAQNTNVHFFIIGEGDQMGQIKTLVSQYKMDDFISFTGFRNDIAEVMPCLDILLFTSEKEGLGTTVLDAFAAKVAVVSTNAGGIPEIISHQVNGFLGEVKNPENLAQGVLQLIKNTDLRNSYIQEALKTVQDYSKSKMAKKTLSVFEDTFHKSLKNSKI